MTIKCCASICVMRVWLLDDDEYYVKFQFSYRNNRYYIKSRNPFDFTVFNFGEE